MITRNKLYYPKSHIITGLCTTGKEWMLEDGTEYIGYYHVYADGTILTEANFNSITSKPLVPYVNTILQPVNAIYNSMKPVSVYIEPQQSYFVPTRDDYTKGKVTRYLLRRRNFSTYEDIMEIDKDQYNLWRRHKGGIDSDLYDAIAIDWKLTGPLHDDKSTINIVYGVFDTNQRMVLLHDVTFSGLKNFLTDYIEMSIYSPYVSSDIKKLFGTMK